MTAPEARHRSGTRGRGVATWVWVTPLAVTVIIAAVVGWLFLIRGADDPAGDGCISGDLVLQVWAAPASGEVARHSVDAYGATGPVVRDRCIRPEVTTLSNDEALAAYRSGAPDAAAVWFPEGTVDLTGLPGAPADAPVIGQTPTGTPVPVAVFGSSASVGEDAARAGADMLRFLSPAG